MSAPCGTRNGYLRHRRAGEAACEPCLDGQRAYQRARDPERRAYNRARSRALQRLAELHLVDYHVLLMQELSQERAA